MHGQARNRWEGPKQTRRSKGRRCSSHWSPSLHLRVLGCRSRGLHHRTPPGGTLGTQEIMGKHVGCQKERDGRKSKRKSKAGKKKSMPDGKSLVISSGQLGSQSSLHEARAPQLHVGRKPDTNKQTDRRAPGTVPVELTGPPPPRGSATPELALLGPWSQHPAGPQSGPLNTVRAGLIPVGQALLQSR